MALGWAQEQGDRDFWTKPELNLLLLVAPGKKSMMLCQGKDEDQECHGGAKACAVFHETRFAI